MTFSKSKTVTSLFALAISVGVGSSAMAQEDWIYKGYYQWHPQTGNYPLGKVGTQCFFCPGKPVIMDSDGDGVMDPDDQCPTTPSGVNVDSKGCALDSDGDGVPDHKDQCPSTPPGVNVDDNGCALDSDGDGVPDNADQCPNTLAGTPVDQSGCAIVTDADGDGVLDKEDSCPDTPKGAAVTQQGCWVLENLRFKISHWNINPESHATLDEVATVLQANPELKIEVQGHTDNRGDARMNKLLSLKRAQAVVNYLVSKGIYRSRLTAEGYGPDRPITNNETSANRAKNRRVELKPVH